MCTDASTSRVRSADAVDVWIGMQCAARLTVIGAALVVGALHAHCPSAQRQASPAGGSAPMNAAGTYRPPAVTAPLAPHTRARVLRVRPPARPAAVRRAAVATTARRARPVTVGTHRPPRAAPPSTSFSDSLAAAVARIPTYRAGTARWVVSTAYDFWGTADWYNDVLYVNPDVPRDKLYDVAVHEWSHELSVLDYASDVASATKAMNAWFGGSGLTGAERAADCMAILQGATWTHYTTCADTHWRAGAARLVAGERL